MESTLLVDEQTEPDPKSHHVYQVAIIGAGISGLSASRHLQKNGVTDVVILEATGKAGGRIHTNDFGVGLVELGAQWIHGEQNEFCQLVKTSNHRNVKTSWEGKGDFLCSDGRKVDNALVDEVLGWIEDTIEEVESTFSIETLEERENGTAPSPCPASATTTSMGQHLLESFHRYLEERHPEFEEESPEYDLRMALFQWGMSFQRIDNSCLEMKDVSLYRWSEFKVNPGEHYNNFANGAQRFVDDVLVAGLGQDDPHVIYNCPVKNINWDSSGEKVTITTRKGSVYSANTVLVTLSIGVLKSNLESLFTPILPERLFKAIYNTGYGPVTKIFLEWEKPWWSADLKGFQFVWPKEYIDCVGRDGGTPSGNLEDIWHKTITGFDPVLDNPNVLLAWLGGPEAVYVESLSDKQIMRQCAQVLRDFTRHDIPEPSNIVVSTWNTNEFFQGAYSFRSVDGDNVKGDICSILCDPVVVPDKHGQNKPVIVLAGEALSKTHYSTLHGAYESGITQATKIVQYYNSASVPSNLTETTNSSTVAAKDSVRQNSYLKASKTNDNCETKKFPANVLAANKNDILKVSS